MKVRTFIVAIMLSGTAMSAQVAPLASSHAPTAVTPAAKKPGLQQTSASVPQVAPKPAIKVNSAVLTDVDVVRQMYAIFPYAQQHSGFPKDIEPQIRKGAVEMLIFEELLYQEAKRRNIVVPAEKVNRGLTKVRNSLGNKAAFQAYLNAECNGSTEVLKEKIRRSFLIESMLKELDQKAAVAPAAAKAYYDKNPKEFERKESFSFQTISILPPANATPAMQAEAKAKITDIVRLARAAKDKEAFGLIAQQISEDDWRMKMGDRGNVPAASLPPEVAKAMRAMKRGQVSGAIQLGTAWVVVRLNGYTAGGKAPFTEVRTKVQAELRKQKLDGLRAELNKKLRKDARVEVL